MFSHYLKKEFTTRCYGYSEWGLSKDRHVNNVFGGVKTEARIFEGCLFLNLHPAPQALGLIRILHAIFFSEWHRLIAEDMTVVFSSGRIRNVGYLQCDRMIQKLFIRRMSLMRIVVLIFIFLSSVDLGKL